MSNCKHETCQSQEECNLRDQAVHDNNLLVDCQHRLSACEKERDLFRSESMKNGEFASRESQRCWHLTHKLIAMEKERDTWGNEFNAVCIVKEQLLEAQSKLACAVEALENCTGGDLASGEGIYKAEIAREALAKIDVDSSPGTVNHQPGPDTHALTADERKLIERTAKHDAYQAVLLWGLSQTPSIRKLRFGTPKKRGRGTASG